MQEAKMHALELENAQLRETLLKAQSMIERLQKRLNAAGISTDAVDLESCVAVESVVRNTLGSVLFRVFIDPPETKEELLSWFTPYLAHLPPTLLQLLVGSSEAPCVIEDAQDIAQLAAVTVTVRIDATASQWYLPPMRAMAPFEDPPTDPSCSEDGGNGGPCGEGDSTLRAVDAAQRFSRRTTRCPLFATANVLVLVSSFVAQEVLVSLCHVCRCARRVLLFDHATATALARPVHVGPQWSLANNVFVLRPVVVGYAMHHAQQQLNGTRPLRLIPDVLHRVAGADDVSGTLPPRERLEAALTYERFASTMRAQFLFLGGVRHPIRGEHECSSSADGAVAPGPAAASQPQAAAAPRVRPEDIRPGAMLDVLDTVQKWYDATVLAVDAPCSECYVHYHKWANQWDEWIDYKRDGHRLQHLGSRFDSAKDPLQSDFRFFQLIRYVATPVTTDRCVVDADAVQHSRFGDSNEDSNASRTAMFNTAEDVRQVAMRLDDEWASVIPSVFAANPTILRCIKNARMISRVAKPRDMVAMVETSYVSRESLVRFMMGATRGGSIADVIDPARIRNDAVDHHLKDVPMVLRLVELYTEETVNAFFVVVNRFGEGLVYTRYGARHWKHT